MKKVSVTYKAPKGDSKVVEMIGHTFFDGKAEEITISDDLYEIVSHNGNFECGKAQDVEKPDISSGKSGDPTEAGHRAGKSEEKHASEKK